MGDLLIRNIPDALKRDLVEVADKSGRSLSEVAKTVLRQGLAARREDPADEEKSAYDILRAALYTEDGASDEFARIMDEIEAERKKDFGRPVEDFE